MKRLLALIMAMALIFCFAACNDDNEMSAENLGTSSGEDGYSEDIFEEDEKPEKLDAEDVVEKSLEAMNEVKSVRANMDAEVEMSIMGKNISNGSEGRMEFDLENGITHLEMNMKSAGIENGMDIYMEYDGSRVNVFGTVNGGRWQRNTVSVDDVAKEGIGYDGVEGIIGYLENMKNIEVEKNGNQYKLTANIGEIMTGQVVDQVLANMGNANGVDKEKIEDIFACFEDTEYIMYIDAETFYVTRFEADLSDAMQKMIENIPTSTGIEEVRYVMSIDYYDYNEYLGLEIPSEAR